jgi:hypothetical protein
MKTVAVLINDKEKQYEGLRSSLGMLLYNTWVQMFVVKRDGGGTLFKQQSQC